MNIIARLLYFTGILSALFVLQACSKGDATQKPLAQTLSLSVGTAPHTLDPHVAHGVPEMKILGALGESLVKMDLVTLEPIPGAAERWEIDDNGLRYVFHLRKDARWSNGDPVTAQDFVFSWQRMLSPNIGWIYATEYYKVAGAEAYHKGENSNPDSIGVKALDTHILEIRLRNASALFLAQLTQEVMMPVHQGELAKHGGTDSVISKWTLAGNYISNGPFLLKTWELNKVIVLEKNPYYWDADRVVLEEIYLYPLESEADEERAYRAGKIQLAHGSRVPQNKIQSYLEKRPNEIKLVDAAGSYYYSFNTSKAPFDNLLVRKAMTHAIDRQAIVNHVVKAGEKVANTLTPPHPLHSKNIKKLEYQPELAAKYLADAGYPNGEGFPEIKLLYNTSDSHRKIALAIQQMWKTVLGINITLENQEWKVFLETRRARDYQIMRDGGISGINDPQDFLSSYTTDHGQNDTGWSNALYDQLVSKATQELDPSKRFKLTADAESILLEELPIIPLYYYIYSYLVAPEVKGIQFNSLGRINFKDIYIEETDK